MNHVPNPDRVYLGGLEAEEGFDYRNLTYTPNSEVHSYTFWYPIPFLRRRSVSLGAKGVVHISRYINDETITAGVDIVKGLDGTSPRNEGNIFSKSYDFEDLEDWGLDPEETEDDVMHLLGFAAPDENCRRNIARIAVAESIFEYSQHEHWLTRLAGVLIEARRVEKDIRQNNL